MTAAAAKNLHRPKRTSDIMQAQKESVEFRYCRDCSYLLRLDQLEQGPRVDGIRDNGRHRVQQWDQETTHDGENMVRGQDHQHPFPRFPLKTLLVYLGPMQELAIWYHCSEREAIAAVGIEDRSDIRIDFRRIRHSCGLPEQVQASEGPFDDGFPLKVSGNDGEMFPFTNNRLRLSVGKDLVQLQRAVVSAQGNGDGTQPVQREKQDRNIGGAVEKKEN
jgi:hypothetical protein